MQEAFPQQMLKQKTKNFCLKLMKINSYMYYYCWTF